MQSVISLTKGIYEVLVKIEERKEDIRKENSTNIKREITYGFSIF